MRVPVRSRIALITLLAMLAVPVPLADASIYSQVLRSYQNQGVVPACQFSSQELATALKSVDTYGAQYFADFTAAIQTALSQRAGGACASNSARAQAALGGPTGPVGKADPSVPQGPVTAATSAGLPAPIALMALLGGLFALLGAAVAVARVRGWDHGWVAAWRHAWGEAGFRIGGTWAEFVDWLRAEP